jgi:DNA polymerase II small subunit
MDEGTLVKKFIEADMQLTEEAFETLRQRPDADAVVDHLLEVLKKSQAGPFTVTAGMISKVLEGKLLEPQEAAVAPPKPAEQVPEPKRLSEVSYTKFKPLAAEHESKVRVLKDITGRSYSEGNIKDFVKLFNNRFEKISRILRKRAELGDTVSIGSLRTRADREQVKVVGIVSSKKRSTSGHLVLDIEDPTGTVSAWAFKPREGQMRSGELFSKVDNVAPDEVIGVLGSVRSGDRYPRIFVNDVVWPDLPVKHERQIPSEPCCAVQISDLHVGSDKFMEDLFMKFVKWLRGEVGDEKQKEMAGKVKYILIAGDVVDGIGIYPEQLEELLIPDIFRQYDVAAKLLAEIPDYITLVIAPGNHDAVRPLEPQPAIPKDFAGGLYNLNSKMVGNPALVSLEGVNFQLYHGRSFDDLIGAIPKMSRQRPAEMMIKLLQKRHVAPIYGGRVALSPEQEDIMVIDEVPDVFHCGHVHVYDCDRYREVWVVNSGTFQGKTEYMKKLGVEPTPGFVSILDLQTNHLSTLDIWNNKLLEG